MTTTLDIIGPAVAVIAGIAAAASIAGAIRAGVLKRVRFGGIEIETNTPEVVAFRQALERSSRGPEREHFHLKSSSLPTTTHKSCLNPKLPSGSA